VTAGSTRPARWSLSPRWLRFRRATNTSSRSRYSLRTRSYVGWRAWGWAQLVLMVCLGRTRFPSTRMAHRGHASTCTAPRCALLEFVDIDGGARAVRLVSGGANPALARRSGTMQQPLGDDLVATMTARVRDKRQATGTAAGVMPRFRERREAGCWRNGR
jgi:hypothetical protein